MKASSFDAMHLARLVDSDLFSEYEKEQIAIELANGLTAERCRALIERARRVIEERKKEAKA